MIKILKILENNFVYLFIKNKSTLSYLLFDVSGF